MSIVFNILSKIRQLRTEMDVSQEQIAFQLDISQGAYSKIERGKIPLTILQLEEIANVLKCPLRSFLEDNEAPETL
jgi:transcriptional regulator with XRE-family HTH domain